MTKGTKQVFNLANNNLILIWVNTLTMKTVAGKGFSFSWATGILNINEYIIYLTVNGNTTITSMFFARLTYDQTAIQSSQTIYLDGGYMLSSGNYNTLKVDFLYKNLTSFMVGLSYFAYNDTQKLNWTFDVNSVTTTGTTSHSWMALSYWNYRFRVCETGYPFYN